MSDLSSITGANNILETNLKDTTCLKQKKTVSTQPIKPINTQNAKDTFVSSKPKEDKKGLFAALAAFTASGAGINNSAIDKKSITAERGKHSADAWTASKYNQPYNEFITKQEARDKEKQRWIEQQEARSEAKRLEVEDVLREQEARSLAGGK